ncbi:MAG: ABC-2 family transporter protein [Candidatus Nealsonbacteria bacterium]|nr:ABC-2 family transporter protein [Candidatus Nealsonbacteria bacterium]
MKKYLAFFKNEFANTAIYRGPLFIWIISGAFYAIVMTAVWKTSQAGGMIGGYTRSELITYYLAALLLDRFINWLPHYSTNEEIRTGQIAVSSLIKPISFYWRKIFQEIGWHTFSVAFGLPFVLILALFFRADLALNFSPALFFWIAAAAILGSLVVFGLSLCLGLLSFWFTDIWAIDSLFWALRMFLAGQALPISFIPGFFQGVIKLLPFRYIFSFPLEIYFHKLSSLEMILGFLTAVFWLVFFALLYKFLWNRGRKAYASFGN